MKAFSDRQYPRSGVVRATRLPRSPGMGQLVGHRVCSFTFECCSPTYRQLSMTTATQDSRSLSRLKLNYMNLDSEDIEGREEAVA